MFIKLGNSFVPFFLILNCFSIRLHGALPQSSTSSSAYEASSELLPTPEVHRVANTSIRYIIRDREIVPYVPPILAYQIDPSPSLKYCLSYCNIQFLSHGGEVAITGEKNWRRNELPHVAVLGYDTGADMKWNSSCGGSLISRNFVLTAGRCVDRHKPTRIRIGETLYTMEKPQILSVLSVHIHPQFKSNPLENDLALLQLNEAVQFTRYMRPACLHKTQGPTSRVDSYFISTKKYGIAGVEQTFDSWRPHTSSWINKDNKTKAETLDVINIKSCGDTEPKESCTGITRKGGDKRCMGDVGSGVYVENSLFDGNRQCPVVIVGVTSAGTQCGGVGTQCDDTGVKCNNVTNYSSVYTRIFPHIPWIESVVWPGQSKPDNPMRKHFQDKLVEEQSGSTHKENKDMKPDMHNTSDSNKTVPSLGEQKYQLIQPSHPDESNKVITADVTASKSETNPASLEKKDGTQLLVQTIASSDLPSPVIVQSNTSSLTFVVRDREFEASVPPAANYVKNSVSLRYCLSYCNIKFIKYGGEMSTVLETENAWVHEYPHVVSFGFKNSTVNGKSNVTWSSCSGSLISRNFVLTSASCVLSKMGQLSKIRIGEYEAQNFSIQDVFIHPDFKANTSTNKYFAHTYNTESSSKKIDVKQNISEENELVKNFKNGMLGKTDHVNGYPSGDDSEFKSEMFEKNHPVMEQKPQVSKQKPLVSEQKSQVSEQKSQVSEQKSQVSEQKSQVQVSEFDFENDIALIQLADHVTFTKYMRPVCLHTGHSSIEDTDRPWNPVATKWRQNSVSTTDVLQKVTLKIKDSDTCNDLLRRDENSTHSMNEKTQLCAGVAKEDLESFQGDPGSSLAVNNTMYHWLRECPMSVVGVTSGVLPDGNEHSVGLYTKVEHYVSWIESIVWPGET